MLMLNVYSAVSSYDRCRWLQMSIALYKHNIHILCNEIRSCN